LIKLPVGLINELVGKVDRVDFIEVLHMFEIEVVIPFMFIASLVNDESGSYYVLSIIDMFYMREVYRTTMSGSAKSIHWGFPTLFNDEVEGMVYYYELNYIVRRNSTNNHRGPKETSQAIGEVPLNSQACMTLDHYEPAYKQCMKRIISKLNTLAQIERSIKHSGPNTYEYDKEVIDSIIATSDIAQKKLEEAVNNYFSYIMESGVSLY
jgi:hypothetical protein